MSKIAYRRLEVLQSLERLTAGITGNRFVSTRPIAIGEQMEEFLLIRLPQKINQWGDVCQFSTGQISIFARDIQGGLENTLMLELMQSAVMELFSDNGVLNTELFSAWDPELLYGGADGAGFHYLTIQFQIQLK